MMSSALMIGFIDEMEKLSSDGKARFRNAALMAAPSALIGSLISKRSLRGAVIGALAGGTLGALASPSKQHEIDDLIDLKEKAKTKEASFMRNVGDVIKQTGRRVGGTAMGMGTNAGRTMKAMVRSPLASTIEGAKWTARDLGKGSRFAKTLGVVGLGAQGLQTYSDIKGLRNAEDPLGRGRGRGERLGKAVGGLAGGLIGSPHGFTGAVVGSGVAEAGLGYAGRGVDKALAKLKSLRAPASAPPSVASNVHPPVTGARVVE